jgi:predicted ATPase/DNA-binding winged helix-turn-helix (wHTH) protein
MTLKFGRFQVLPHRREFLADGMPVAIGSRAFDVLMVLIEAGGELVTKDDILSRVWPGMVVEEHSLQFHISALRKVLGEDRGFIKTISGRGYRFVAEITAAAGEQEALVNRSAALPSPLPEAEGPTNLPAPSQLIGREVELSEATALATAHRLVTLVGAGGIGKTRLGLEVARRLRPSFADGVWVAELGPLSDPDLVPVTVATALGLEIVGGAVTSERVARQLGERQLLLVLNNCEHVIDAAASLAEALLRANPTARVIATSREPLRAADECLYRVPPLAVPVADYEDAHDPLRYGAVRLFVERMQAAEPRFAPDRFIGPMIASICRQLDGVPLAIELAAACAAALGIEAVAARLADRFHLLINGRRTALPQHQTLRATFDWSYELLADHERALLRRLAIFAGTFSLEAAAAVVVDNEIAATDVAAIVASLVAKSLVATQVDGTLTRYRLLDTTRAYAREKLDESDERERLTRRHARYFRDLFEQAECEWKRRPASEWLNENRRHIDDLHAALDWAFSPKGDASIGVALTAAAVPLWMHLSLMEECRARVERALAAFGAGVAGDARAEMKLHASLGASLIYARGAVAEVGAAWTRAFELAENLDDAEYQLRSLLGLCFFQTAGGRHRAALASAQRFCSLAAKRADQNDRVIGERLLGVSQHYLGDQPSARRHLEQMLAHYVSPAQKPHIIPFSLDQQVMARALLARVLWLQGFPDQAMRAAKASIADARACDHANSLCYALSQAACPIALLVGDLVAAERYVEMLHDQAARHGLALWHAWGVCYRGVLVIKRGDIATGLRSLHDGYDRLGEARFAGLRLFAFEMAESLGCVGQIAAGLGLVEETIERCERTDERWQSAELRRIKGELVLREGARDAEVVADDLFRQALEHAHRQGALSWELRAATDLAWLLRNQGRSADATALLQTVYDRFTEGFETTDLKAAEALLDALLKPAASECLTENESGILNELLPSSSFPRKRESRDRGAQRWLLDPRFRGGDG